MSKRNVAHVAQSTNMPANLSGQGNTMPEIVADTEAVTIVTAPTEESPRQVEQNRASSRISGLSNELAALLASGDDLAADKMALTKAYGALTDTVSAMLAPLVMADVGEVVEVYLNRLSGNITKSIMASRKNVIKKAFSKSFENYIIDFEYSNKRAAYNVFIEAKPSADVVATANLLKALDACSAAKLTKADIMAILADYYQ